MKRQEWDLLLRNVHLATMDTARSGDYGTVLKGALAVAGNRIAWVGAEVDLPSGIPECEVVDGQGGWVLPGLIDPHTHLVWAGSRVNEFELRQQGVAYDEIARQGGGILSTVSATRKASFDMLYQESAARLESLLREGVTCVEIKSGYGLESAAEMKMLKVARALQDNYPVTIKTTFLAAHALPLEFTGRADDYIQVVCDEMLPAAWEAGLIDAVDVFCEHIAFSLSQCERLFQRAQALGVPVKIHGEQLSNMGATNLVARYQGLSADHLEYLDASGIAAMARAGTVATLLPGAFYYLKESRRPPVQALRDAGVAVALGSDCNPGTSPISSPRVILNLACILFGFTPAEALAGMTRNAALALGQAGQMGQLRTGLLANLALWPIDQPAALAASVTGERPRLVLHHGRRSDFS